MRATVWPSVRSKNANFGGHFAHPDTEDKKLRKERLLGGPCFEGTLRSGFYETNCFPNEVPWPGRLRLLSLNLDAGRCREMQQKRPASHTSALGELFIADE
jgi:hypothetical protein